MTPLTFTPYQRRYLQPIRDLLFRSHSVHTHLDWNETDQWLEAQQVPMRLAWQNSRLVGVLATSTPLHDTCWIRLAATQDQADQSAILSALWGELLPELRDLGVKLAALLGVREWITDFAPMLGFHYVEDIITLARASRQIPDMPPHNLILRPAEPTDLDALSAVDQAAFNPPWQLTPDELRQAYRISASCTVALADGQLIAYQLSTLYFDGAHLARLAVVPELQGRGIGGVLLDDMLHRFARRGVYAMTVNTQSTNIHSQHLYRRYGFRPNGYDLPYWSANL